MNTRQKLVLLGSLYVSQGLPYGFFTQALPALLRQLGRSLPEIGLASLLALPWALKFLWAPAVDRVYSTRLGRRRSWILPLQAITIVAMGTLAWLDPNTDLTLVLVGFFVANLLAATQDIATDGLAVSLLTPSERGWGNGLQVAGYRVGMILGGGALLVFYEHIGWTGIFMTMAGLLTVASLPVLRHTERPTPRQDVASAPLRTVVMRPGMLRWLGVLLCFKFGEALAGAMLRPMLVDLGLGLSQLGWILGTAGFSAGLLGALAGGWAAGRLGRRPVLLAVGLLQAATVGLYALPAMGLGAELHWLTLLVVVEHAVGGAATAALFTAMMDRCDPHTGGTDYTVQASVVVVSTGTAAALSGLVAEPLGYPAFFAVGAGLSVLGLLPLVLVAESSPPQAVASASAATTMLSSRRTTASGRSR